MATIITRAGKGTALTYNEVDSNFTNLNNEKLDTVAGGTVSAPTVFSVNSASDALRVTQEGVGLAIRVEDSANPDATPFVVTGSGLVGVGTASPNTNLQVIGQAFFGLDSNRVRLNSSAATGIIEFNSNEGKVSNNQVGGVLTFASSGGVEHLRIDSSGNVGIGTTTPSTGLEVSNGTFRNQLTVHRVNNSATTTMGSIALAGNNGSGTKTTYVQIEAFTGSVAAGAENGNLLFSTMGGGTLAERLRIDSSGNVGIANVNPTTAGATNYRNLVVGSTGVANNGITIQSSTAGNGGLVFNATNGAIQGSITYSHSIDELAFASGGSARLRIDSTGRVLVGSTSARNIGTSLVSSSIQVEGTNSNSSSILAYGNANTFPVSGTLVLGKSRGTAVGSVTAVQSGDSLGRIHFMGADGTSGGVTGAFIIGQVDGTVATNVMPGALTFWTTPASSNTPLERLRIDSAGLVGINTTSPSSTNGGLDISSGGLSLIFGADNGASTRTNATIKIGRIGAYHYTNASTPTTIAVASNTSTSNDVYIGGGTSSLNAATFIGFYTAANTTTTTGTIRLSIDSSGRVLVGGTSTTYTTGSVNARFQLTGNDANSGSASISRYSADTSPAYLVLAKSRSGTVGTMTAVASGDELGRIEFAGADGTDLGQSGAFINAFVDGTVANNSIPGRLSFWTTSVGGTTPAARVIIDSAGRLLVGNFSSQSVGGVDSALQNHGTTLESASHSSVLFNTAGSGALVRLGSSRGVTVGTYTASTSGDEMGRLSFSAADGSTMVETAYISSTTFGASGGLGSGVLRFFTSDGGAAPLERLTIFDTGNIAMTGDNTSNPSTTFSINGGSSAGSTGGAVILFAKVGSGLAYVGHAGAMGATGTNLALRTDTGGIDFYTGGILSTNIRMRIGSAGGVGIGNITATSQLHVAGPIATTVTSTAATAYNILDTDSVVLLTAVTGTITATLPTAVGCTGREYTIIRTGTGATSYTVNTTSSQTINGSLTFALSAQYSRVKVVSNGANWFILNT